MVVKRRKLDKKVLRILTIILGLLILFLGIYFFFIPRFRIHDFEKTIEIPYEVSELTHITNDMLEDAPPIEHVIKQFYDFSKDCVLCGHNVIGFDIKFIRRFGSYYDLTFDNDIIDTMNEARVSKLKISRFNLGTVTKALGIELVGAHRAWNDAYATAQVLLKLNELGR